MRHRAIGYFRNGIQIFAFLSVCCLTQTTHIQRILPQDVYIWQKKWVKTLQPAIEKTTPFINNWRFLAGEYEPDEQVIYPSVQFDLLRQSKLPLTAVYRFDRIRPLPSTDEVLALIQNSPAYALHHIHQIELDLDWPTSKLKQYIALLQGLKSKLPTDVELNITMIPDWLRSPYLPNLTEEIQHPVLQVHSVDDPNNGLFSPSKALAYINKMTRSTKHNFYIALPTYGLKIQTTLSGTIYAIEGENNFKTGNSGHELYSDPQQVRMLIHQLEQNTPSHLQGIVWFRLPIEGDQRNWSFDTWLAMLDHRELKGKIVIQEIPEPSAAKTYKINVLNQGNIVLPLPQTIALRCKVGDGFYPYQLSTDNKGAYQLSLIKQTAPLNTNQQRIVGWMRCE